MAKGKVTFDTNGCKGCELCIEVCPKKILVVDDKKINAKGYHPIYCNDEESCTGCGNCATMCPDSIITVERE